MRTPARKSECKFSQKKWFVEMFYVLFLISPQIIVISHRFLHKFD